MKKSLLVVMMMLGFALQEPVYDKVDEYVYCIDYSKEFDGVYNERVYFVQQGLLIKMVEYEYLPFSYFESKGVLIEDAYYELMDEYVYRGYEHVGYSSLAPYYDSEAIVNPFRVVDFSDLSVFSNMEIANEVKTGDHKNVIFELYINKYEKSNNCSLK